MDTIDPKGELDNVRELKPKRAGASAERMRELTRIRMEKIAAGDESAKGGKRRIKPLTDDEVRDVALQKAADYLVPAKAAALRELEKMLESKDPKERQFAVKMILEYTEGKPTQTIDQRTDQVTTVRYETVALPQGFVPQALDDAAAS